MNEYIKIKNNPVVAVVLVLKPAREREREVEKVLHFILSKQMGIGNIPVTTLKHLR